MAVYEELKKRLDTIEFLTDLIYHGDDQEEIRMSALALEDVVENTKSYIYKQEA